jgi:hypothetical protein
MYKKIPRLSGNMSHTKCIVLHIGENYVFLNILSEDQRSQFLHKCGIILTVDVCPLKSAFVWQGFINEQFRSSKVVTQDLKFLPVNRGIIKQPDVQVV